MRSALTIAVRIARTSIHFCSQCGAPFIATRPWGATYEFSEMKDGKLVDDDPCTVTVDNYKNPAELEEPFKDAFCRFVEAHELQAGSLVCVRTTLHNQNAIDVPAAEEKVYCIGSVNWVKETRMALPWSTKAALLGVLQNKPQKIGAAVEEIDSSIAAFLHSPFA